MTASKHNRTVAATARGYRLNGYNVKAHLEGEERPKTINGHIPDIIAKKGNDEVIIEIETPSTKTRDSDQRRAFRSYANRSKNRRFIVKIAK